MSVLPMYLYRLVLVLLQSAVVGYFALKYKENPPVMVVCEASAADCLYQLTAQADGNLVNIAGDLQTNK